MLRRKRVRAYREGLPYTKEASAVTEKFSALQEVAGIGERSRLRSSNHLLAEQSWSATKIRYGFH